MQKTAREIRRSTKKPATNTASVQFRKEWEEQKEKKMLIESWDKLFWIITKNTSVQYCQIKWLNQRGKEN